MRPPIEHRFTIDGDTYLLVEYVTRGGEARLQAFYAAGLAKAAALSGVLQASTILDAIDGASLYVEAVARECLKEAPDFCWRPRKADEPPNQWDPLRVITLDQFPRDAWPQFLKEVDAFMASLPQVVSATPAPAFPVLSPDAPSVETPKAVPPVFLGKAS